MPEEKTGLSKAIMNELFSLSATVPNASQRCIELNIPVDRGSLQNGVIALRKLYIDEIKTCYTMDCNTTPEKIISEIDSELVATVFSCIIKLPIVIIESGAERYVRPFLPTLDLITADVIYLVHNMEINKYYNTKRKETSSECFCLVMPNGIACQEENRARCSCKILRQECSNECACKDSCSNKQTALVGPPSGSY